MNVNQKLSTDKTLQVIGLACLSIGLLTVIWSALVYAPDHAGFSIFNTYLSDIGDSGGWGETIFKSGTLMAAPLRLLVLALVLLNLRHLGGKRPLIESLALFFCLASAAGTVLMTAVPYSSEPAIHKSGIGLYFLGAIFLQVLMGIRELRIKGLPRSLPVLSFFVVFCFLVFVLFYGLLLTGQVGRSTPVFFEWMCFFSSMLWIAGHTWVLGGKSYWEGVK